MTTLDITRTDDLAAEVMPNLPAYLLIKHIGRIELVADAAGYMINWYLVVIIDIADSLVTARECSRMQEIIVLDDKGNSMNVRLNNIYKIFPQYGAN